MNVRNARSMDSTSSNAKVSATFNGSYHDVQGNQDNRHSRAIGTINSTFNTIGGDRIDSRSYTTIVHIHAGPPGASLPQLIQTAVNASNLVGRSDGLAVQMESYHQRAMIASDSAIALIISIVQLLLVNRTDPSDKAFRDMERSLKLLYDTISTTRVALQVFERTPLGRNLAITIEPTVLDCCENLQKLLGKLEDYRSGLSYTSVRSLWRNILWSAYEDDEIHAVSNKLSGIQATLGEFLAAINSISWSDLGNGLRSGEIPLQKFRTFLQHGPFHLQHIPLSRIIVVDHLGSNIPIPTMFCSTWQDFCYIINGYCKGRAGVNFVEQGEFELIRPEDNQTVNPSNFVSAAQPGMVFEMSIVLKEILTMLGNYKTRCPRCRHVNDAGNSVNGWIECRRCSGNFQVALESSQHKVESRSDDEVKPGDSENAATPTVTPSTDKEEELISPASTPDRTTLTPSKEEELDEKHFFRRIRLLCIAAPRKNFYRSQVGSVGGPLPGASYPPGPQEQLPAPQGFSRPVYEDNPFTPFETMKIQDMDDFLDNHIPRMPLVLQPHDVFPEDWKRLMQDLALAWSGRFPILDSARGGRPPKETTLTSEILDLWTGSFFFARGVEPVLYKGRERRSGPNAGTIDRNIDYGDSDSLSDDSDDVSSEDDTYRSGSYDGPATGSGRRKEQKREKKRRYKEKRARKKAKARENKYALYLTYVPLRDPEGVIPGNMPGGIPGMPVLGMGY